jgi:hypothetical protein
VLCLSEFYFLNRSSAKQSANSSDELTCDHDKNTLIEYKGMVKELENKLVDLEERRAGLETQVANVQYLPRLTTTLKPRSKRGLGKTIIPSTWRYLVQT